ncbi:MAG: TonB-dependent receptor [Vicinamibacteria bacterium]|jgi:outer membrane cobalamin receptor|nr:TonB-dependent receptor [Vicinamibacteria bacterium]
MIRLIGMAIVCAQAAHAQDTGGWTGSLVTRDGSGVPLVVLRLDGPAGERTIVTGTAGRFAVEGLLPGDYRVSPQTPGVILQGTRRVSIVAARQSHAVLTLAPTPLRQQVLVSATRSEAALPSLGTTATVFDADQLAAREAPSLVSVLQEVPGLAVARAGGLGQQASVFLRGGESRFARVLVDGVPLNEPGGLNNFGGQLPFDIERIEIVRGAASSLYGSDALAGVIQYVTPQAASGRHSRVRAALEGGSFDTRRAQGGWDGRYQSFDWNAGAVRLTTDNQQPNSDFSEWAGAASVGWQAGPRSQLRVTARVSRGEAGTPGQTGLMRPDLDARHQRSDGVVGARWRRLKTRGSHELRVSATVLHQLSVNPLDSGEALPQRDGRMGWPMADYPNQEGFQNNTARFVLGYQGERDLGGRNLLTWGAEWEQERGSVGDRRQTLLRPTRRSAGLYVQDRLLVGTRLSLLAGGRIERNGSYGTTAVPRASLAYRWRGQQNSTSLRLSAGTGIKEPSLIESFGTDLFAQGNPQLKPERSRTADLGIEQRLAQGRLIAEATVFHHAYMDQIAWKMLTYSPFMGSYANLGRTRARGLELDMRAEPMRRVQTRLVYTYLDGIIQQSADSDPGSPYRAGQPLLRRPKHQGAWTLSWDGARAGAGSTLLYVGARCDSDFSGLNLTRNSAYWRFDARARARVGAQLEIYAAAENLLDASYEEALGYPSLGRSIRVGLRIAPAKR